MSTLSSLPNIQAGRTMMNARIASAVSAGTVSSTDQSALATALDDIDSALSSTSGSSTASRTSMQDKIAALIDSQVSAGTLTEDQASQLEAFFAPPTGGTEAASGSGSVSGEMMPPPMDGPNGPPPPPPPSDSDDTSDTTSSTSSTREDQLAALVELLDKLRSSLASTTYGSTAATNSTGLVVNAVG